MRDHLPLSNSDSFAFSFGARSGFRDSDDVILDLFYKRVLASAEQRNLTNRGLGQELFGSFFPKRKKSLMAEESILLSISEKYDRRLSRSLFNRTCLLSVILHLSPLLTYYSTTLKVIIKVYTNTCFSVISQHAT